MSSSFLDQVPFLLGTICSFLSLHHILKKIIPTPDLIEQEKDKKKQIIDKNEHFAYYYALFHSVPIIFYGIYMLITGPVRFEDVSNSVENRYLAYSLGFFIADTIQGFISGYNDSLMLIHHIISIVVSLVTIITNHYAYVVIIIWVIGEISNPILAIGMILQKSSSRQFESFIFGLLFSLVFIIARGPFISYLCPIIFKMNISIFLKFSLSIWRKFIRVLVFILVLYYCQLRYQKNHRSKIKSKRKSS